MGIPESHSVDYHEHDFARSSDRDQMDYQNFRYKIDGRRYVIAKYYSIDVNIARLGRELKLYANSMIAYSVALQKIPATVTPATGGIMPVETFTEKFAQLYENNKTFQSSLIVGLLEAFVIQLSTPNASLYLPQFEVWLERIN